MLLKLIGFAIVPVVVLVGWFVFGIDPSKVLLVLVIVILALAGPAAIWLRTATWRHMSGAQISALTMDAAQAICKSALRPVETVDFGNGIVARTPASGRSFGEQIYVFCITGSSDIAVLSRSTTPALIDWGTNRHNITLVVSAATASGAAARRLSRFEATEQWNAIRTEVPF